MNLIKLGTELFGGVVTAITNKHVVVTINGKKEKFSFKVCENAVGF